MTEIPMKNDKPGLEAIAKDIANSIHYAGGTLVEPLDARISILQALLNWQIEQDARVADEYRDLCHPRDVVRNQRAHAARKIAQAIRNQGEK